MDKEEIFFDSLTERQIELLRLDSSVRKEILKILKDLEKEIVSGIATANEVKEKHLKALFLEVSSLIDETFQIINNENIEVMKSVCEIEYKAISSDMAKLSVSTTKIPIAKLEKLASESLIGGAPSKVWWSRQSENLKRNFQDQIRIGVLLGEDNQKLINRVRGTKDLGYSNGIMSASKREAEVLVRSSVQTAANQTRYSVFESMKTDFDKYRYVSTLDSRTSPQCAVRDGKEWESETKNPVGHNIPFQVPPIHFGCRSTIIAIIPGFDISKMQRASKDGQVNASTTFESWLKGKDSAFVEKLLGKGKAELYLKGDISLNQLLDQSGNPLSLEELKKKYV